jgi:hypothetical protein
MSVNPNYVISCAAPVRRRVCPFLPFLPVSYIFRILLQCKNIIFLLPVYTPSFATPACRSNSLSDLVMQVRPCHVHDIRGPSPNGCAYDRCFRLRSVLTDLARLKRNHEYWNDFFHPRLSPVVRRSFECWHQLYCSYVPFTHSAIFGGGTSPDRLSKLRIAYLRTAGELPDPGPSSFKSYRAFETRAVSRTLHKTLQR